MIRPSKFPSAVRPAVLLALTAIVSACTTVGPDFRRPDTTVPAQWRGTGRQNQPASLGDASTVHRDASVGGATFVSANPDPRWWRAFNDPLLDQLVEKAISGNLDLQQAVMRIASSRANEQIAGAAGLPSLGANAKYTRQQLGAKGLLQESGAYDSVDALGAPGSALNTLAPGSGANISQSARSLLNSINTPVSLYQIGFDASWELDLFGKVRRSVEASNAQFQASVEQRNDALVSLEAEVARTYAQLRGAQTARRVTLDLIRSEQDILALTRSQQKAGLTSETDVQSARVQLAQSQAQLPQYDGQISVAMNALAVLTGQPPGTLDTMLEAPGAIPPVPPTVPVGLPGSLVRRRPDIRQAEARLHEATAEVGVATADLFPDVSLTGNFGMRSLKARDLTTWANHFYSFGPSITLPIFQGGKLVGNIRMSKAEEVTAALGYRKAVLNALSDVENALANYDSAHGQRVAYENSVDAASHSLDLARDAYRRGLTSFVTVAQAQATLAQNQGNLVQATLTETTNLVAVYKALGGGWENAPDDTVGGSAGNGQDGANGASPTGPASADPRSEEPPPVGTQGNAGQPLNIDTDSLRGLVPDGTVGEALKTTR